MASSLRHIIVRRKPGERSKGLLTFGGKTHVCALGKGGISAFKREGDGATPLGSMRIVSGYFRADGMKMRVAGLPLTRIKANSGWCDAVGDRNYNRPVKMPYPASCESMKRADALYDLVLVLDYNLKPRRQRGGSAIFFHIARDGLAPTEGCVALPKPLMLKLLSHLSNKTILTVLG